MTCLSPEPGETVEQAADRWRSDGTLPAETADEIVEFAAFLRTTAELGLKLDEPLPPNVMRRFRVLLGMTHSEIDAHERQLWRDTGREGEPQW